MISKKNLTPLILSLIFFLMLGLSFAAVPLYDLFCRVTGFGGTTQISKEAPKIVIDEVLGQSMPLIMLLYLNQNNQISISIEIYYILSFVFFRFFDILKPFPVSYFDKNHKNYFGIIMDDIMAGLYSMILIYFISIKF